MHPVYTHTACSFSGNAVCQVKHLVGEISVVDKMSGLWLVKFLLPLSLDRRILEYTFKSTNGLLLLVRLSCQVVFPAMHLLGEISVVDKISVLWLAKFLLYFISG